MKFQTNDDDAVEDDKDYDHKNITDDADIHDNDNNYIDNNNTNGDDETTMTTTMIILIIFISL